MSSFTGVSSIRNVQWKFQKNLQESILLILKTQYIFEFSGLFHCSVIKVLCCRFCVSDKSLRSWSCGLDLLCGISSRFQLLSPSARQVTHALLTRPPLSHKHLPSEKFCRKCFVRLACVKHAASVHPEPGSNSQIKMFDSAKISLG